MGKNYQGTDIRTLPNGSGYMYIRQAVRKVIDMFRTLCENISCTYKRQTNKYGRSRNE